MSEGDTPSNFNESALEYMLSLDDVNSALEEVTAATIKQFKLQP